MLPDRAVAGDLDASNAGRLGILVSGYCRSSAAMTSLTVPLITLMFAARSSAVETAHDDHSSSSSGAETGAGPVCACGVHVVGRRDGEELLLPACQTRNRKHKPTRRAMKPS